MADQHTHGQLGMELKLLAEYVERPQEIGHLNCATATTQFLCRCGFLQTPSFYVGEW
jgi:hypothetical protein